MLCNLHTASPFIDTNTYNDETVPKFCEVEDQGRQSQIVFGNFSVPLIWYFKASALVTFEVLCHEATNSLDSYVKRGLLIGPSHNIPTKANEQTKKDGRKDEELYLSKEIENEGPQYNSIWVTGRMKIMSDSHCKLVPD